MNGAGSVTGVATWKDVQNICRAILVRWRIVIRGVVEKRVLQKPSSAMLKSVSVLPFSFNTRRSLPFESHNKTCHLVVIVFNKTVALYQPFHPRSRTKTVDSGTGYAELASSDNNFSFRSHHMLLDIPFSLAGYSMQELANNKHPHVLQAANSPIELSILSLFVSNIQSS